MRTVKAERPLAFDLISVIAIVYILYVLKPLIVPLIIASILSVMVFPLVKYLERKWRFNRVVSALTVLLLLAIISAIFFSFLCFQVKDFAEKSDMYVTKLSELYQKSLSYFQQNYGIDTKQLTGKNELKFETLLKNNFSKIGVIISESSSIISDMFLIPIYIFFFLLYRKFFIMFIHKVFTRKHNRHLNIILGKIYEVQKSYLAGLVTVMGIVGVLNSIGLLILGIENAIFFGFLGAILLLIPYIGIIIGSLLPALVALATKDSYWYAFGVIGVFGFVQILEGNFITPKITGSKVSVNSFIAVVSLIAFSMLWGTAGMVLALPVTASLKIIFDHSTNLKPYGFLIGEPLDEHLKSSAMVRLKKWKVIRMKKRFKFGR